MGNSLSPILSHFVLEDLLDMTMRKTKFKVKLLLKYVDDLIILIDPKLINILLSTMNDYHPRLRFTLEEENSEQEINYLDMTIILREMTMRFSLDGI